MYSLIRILFLILAISQYASTQSCFDNGFSPLTQAEVDILKDPAYNNCKIIGGDVKITGNDITDLSAFRNIEEIHGDLLITSNPQLLNLDGFENLTLIKGVVRIQSNDLLESFEGLMSLKKIEGEFVYFINLPSISSLNGLNNLDSILGIFHIANIDNLEDLSGLNSLKSVKKAFNIFNNEKLKNLNGLENLTEAGDRLGITENPALLSIENLNENLIIQGPLVINKNPKLELCKAKFICNYLDTPPQTFYVISENSTSCSLEDVIDFCESITNTVTRNTMKKTKIFPNPAKSTLNITNEHMFESYLFSDMNGRTMLKGKITDNKIDLTELPVGIYSLQLNNQYSSEFQVVVKQ